TVEALINRYVEHIPSINSAPKVTAAQLNVVEDSPANFQEYDRLTTEIEMERHAGITAAYSSESAANGPDSVFLLVQTMGSAYEKAALRHRDIPVPNSVANAHTKL